MTNRKRVLLPAIALSAVLSSAALFAQEAGTGGGQAGNAGAPAQTVDSRRGDLGLLGLIGLLGLGGLMRRGRESLSPSDRPSTR